MSPTLDQITSRVIQDLGLGQSMDSIDAIAVGSVTQSNYLRNSNWGGNQFLNWGIVRPDAASSADYFRYAGALVNSTGLLAQTGANYSDTTATSETMFLLEPGVRPDQDIWPAINRGLEFCAFHTTEPLSLAADAAMRETSATASWGTASNTTPTKSATDATFPGMGIKALVLTNTAANGYQPTASIPVSPGETIMVGTLSRVKTGPSTATHVLFDVTNSAVFTESGSTLRPQHAESTWQYMQTIATVPSGCVNLQVRLQASGGNNTVTVWQALWVMRSSILRYDLPSYADERYKVDSISLYPFTMATSNTASQGVVMQALSVNPADLNRDEYSTDFPMPEANPTYVQFHPGNWQAMWTRRFGPRYGPGAGAGSGYFPLTIQMRIPFSERGTLAAGSDATTCPLHLITPAAEVQLLSSSKEAQKNATKTLAQVKAEFTAAAGVRSTQGPARTKMMWRQPTLIN